MPWRDPPRVLHVLRALNRGGLEKWLLDVLRNTPPGAWQTEFLVHASAPGAYDEQVRALGGTIRSGPAPRPLPLYVPRLRELLRRFGPYDVVHSHLHFFSGWVLLAAHQAGVPVRIAQSNTTEPVSGLARSAYAGLARGLIARHATHCTAISDAAGVALFGAHWRADPRAGILDCALDFAPYLQLPARAVLKQQLGIAPDRTVIGHVGRFEPVKNHAFVLDTFVELVNGGLNAQLLLVGSGPLEAAVRARAVARGIAHRCMFAGAQDDVAPYFGAMDLMIFPSLYEGLALAPLEAQAAGTPVLESTAVPAEGVVVADLVHRRNLDDGAAAWAGAALSILRAAPRVDRAACARALQRSRFGIAHAVAEMAALYGAAAVPGSAR